MINVASYPHPDHRVRAFLGLAGDLGAATLTL